MKAVYLIFHFSPALGLGEMELTLPTAALIVLLFMFLLKRHDVTVLATAKHAGIAPRLSQQSLFQKPVATNWEGT